MSTLKSHIENRELAGNATFVAAVTWLECAFCAYLSNDAGLTRVDAPCPHCGESGRPRRLTAACPSLCGRMSFGARSYVMPSVLRTTETMCEGVTSALTR